MRTHFKLAALSGAMALSLGFAAQASEITDLFVTGANNASDDDREYLIDRTYSYTGADTDVTGEGVVGQVDIGDSLRGLFSINTLNASGSGANVGGETGTNEWTGVYQVLVTSKVCVTGLGCAFTFAPDPAFEAIYGTGAIFAFYEDSAINYQSDFATAPDADNLPALDDGTTLHTIPPSQEDVSTGPYETEEDFIATATDGQLFWVLGFTGEQVAVTAGSALDALGFTSLTSAVVGEGFNTTTNPGLDDQILNAINFATGSAGGLFNTSVSLIDSLLPTYFETTGVVINKVTPSVFGGTTQFAASGSIRGIADLNTPFEISSNIDMSWNSTVTTVPEPGSLALLGLGLSVLGATARRRRRK